VPWGIRNLTGLHALQNVKASLETLCDIAALSELITLAVSNVKSEHFFNLCTAIMNMSHLAHLSISASNETEVLPVETLHLPASWKRDACLTFYHPCKTTRPLDAAVPMGTIFSFLMFFYVIISLTLSGAHEQEGQLCNGSQSILRRYCFTVFSRQ
jgi:hypothetical protein